MQWSRHHAPLPPNKQTSHRDVDASIYGRVEGDLVLPPGHAEQFNKAPPAKMRHRKAGRDKAIQLVRS